MGFVLWHLSLVPQAANFLDLKPMLDITCKAVAEMIKGKTPDEIKKVFGVEGDFTDEEKAQVLRDNPWLVICSGPSARVCVPNAARTRQPTQGRRAAFIFCVCLAARPAVPLSCVGRLCRLNSVEMRGAPPLPCPVSPGTRRRNSPPQSRDMCGMRR